VRFTSSLVLCAAVVGLVFGPLAIGRFTLSKRYAVSIRQEGDTLLIYPENADSPIATVRPPGLQAAPQRPDPPFEMQPRYSAVLEYDVRQIAFEPLNLRRRSPQRTEPFRNPAIETIRFPRVTVAAIDIRRMLDGGSVGTGRSPDQHWKDEDKRTRDQAAHPILPIIERVALEYFSEQWSEQVRMIRAGQTERHAYSRSGFVRLLAMPCGTTLLLLGWAIVCFVTRKHPDDGNQPDVEQLPA
jgi:hypothetical protein